MSIVGILGVAFIILKLLGIIHWSWWLVTLPLWGGTALFLAVCFVCGTFFTFSILRR